MSTSATAEGTASALPGVGVPYRILPLRSGGRCRQAEGGALRLQRCPLPAFGHLPPQAGEGTASTLSGVDFSYRILPLRSGGRDSVRAFRCRRLLSNPSPAQRGKGQRPRFPASASPIESCPRAAGEGAGRRKGALFDCSAAPFRPSAPFPRKRGKGQRPRFPASASPIEPFLRARGKEQPGQPPQSMHVVPRGLTAPAGTRARHVPRAAPARNTRCGNFPSYTFPLRR